MDTIFSIYMVYQWPYENILKNLLSLARKTKVKGGRLVKKWEFSQTKKIYKSTFLKKSFAFMTYGRLPPKNSSKLRFVIWD